jgi:hypothetical protein
MVKHLGEKVPPYSDIRRKVRHGQSGSARTDFTHIVPQVGPTQEGSARLLARKMRANGTANAAKSFVRCEPFIKGGNRRIGYRDVCVTSERQMPHNTTLSIISRPNSILPVARPHIAISKTAFSIEDVERARQDSRM